MHRVVWLVIILLAILTCPIWITYRIWRECNVEQIKQVTQEREAIRSAIKDGEAGSGEGQAD